MSNNQTVKISIFNTEIFNVKPITGCDWSKSEREDFHLERGANNEVKVVSDGITDYQKVIDSHKGEAGLTNILRFQEMRYGSVDNAIVANEQKKLYADVSNIPDGVGAQAELVAKTNADVEKLAKELGISKSELINLTAEQYIAIKQKQAAAAAAANEGGAE